jgi:hypothetical protein
MMDICMKKMVVIRHLIIYFEHNYDETYMLLMFIDGDTLLGVNAVPVGNSISEYRDLKKYRFQFFSSN